MLGIFTVERDNVAVDADSLPTAVCYVDGVATADVVTITNLSTGRYKASVSHAGLTSGKKVEVVVSVTVGGETQEIVAISETYTTTDADVHLAKAFLMNKRIITTATGAIQVYDDDGTTLLKTLTPTEAAGVVTLTPS